MDFPLAGVAVVLKMKGGTIDRAKVVLGAVGSSPITVVRATELLEGQKPTEDLLQSVVKEALANAQPVGNLAIDASYRRKMVGVLVKRALRRALAMAPND
jgi:CO/xanthine dehydrogenase FAD-binding subunit